MVDPISPNSRESIGAIDSISRDFFYLEGTSPTGALNVNASVQFPGLIEEQYDYVSVAYPIDTTEVYTFKSGGAGGTTVATITIVYLDNTKANLSTVTRS